MASQKAASNLQKEIKQMMYGFGDEKEPNEESLQLVYELSLEYIDEMTRKAAEISRDSNVKPEDILFLIRKDQKKFGRALDMMAKDEEQKKAKKEFSGLGVKL